MQGDIENKNRRRRKKKSKFGYYLYASVVLVLTIANITLAALLLTYVQTIQVNGNENSQKNEIVSWIKEDELTINSLYTLWKFKSGSYTLPIYLENIEVSLGAPWKVEVEVTEKEVIGCFIIEQQYVYFDAEGLVMKKSVQYEEGVPIIEGVQVEDAQQFAYLKADNEKIFSYISDIAEELQKNDLSPNRLVWEDESMNLYFENICVRLGKLNYDEKLSELPPILEYLEGESGVLDMEHYTEDTKSTSFEKNT